MVAHSTHSRPWRCHRTGVGVSSNSARARAGHRRPSGQPAACRRHSRPPAARLRDDVACSAPRPGSRTGQRVSSPNKGGICSSAAKPAQRASVERTIRSFRQPSCAPAGSRAGATRTPRRPTSPWHGIGYTSSARGSIRSFSAMIRTGHPNSHRDLHLRHPRLLAADTEQTHLRSRHSNRHCSLASFSI